MSLPLMRSFVKNISGIIKNRQKTGQRDFIMHVTLTKFAATCREEFPTKLMIVL